MKKALCILTAAALAIPAATASAGDVQVRFNDLNLSSKAGQSTLSSRIDAAARKACDVGAIRSGTRLASANEKRCIKAAKKQVESQVSKQIAAAAEQ